MLRDVSYDQSSHVWISTKVDMRYVEGWYKVGLWVINGLWSTIHMRGSLKARIRGRFRAYKVG